ncbi:hypothetical protein [Microbacterium deminutum]|uniref:DUF7882 family protein n=1 Tax=Microbacterium deminutum TaxID=344164 RepID=UPI0031E10356
MQSREFDDRTLAHLAVVINDKLRRGEAFSFSFTGDGGPATCWVSREVPLRFDFDDSAQVSINRKWVLVLERASQTGQGLRVVPEPSNRPPLSAPRPAAELRKAVRS